MRTGTPRRWEALGKETLGKEGKALEETIARAGKLWECKEKNKEVPPLVLKGSRMKTG